MNAVRDDDPRLQPRVLVARESHTDRTETLTFRCGHSVVAIIPGLAEMPVPCAECVSELLKEYRSAHPDRSLEQG